MANLFLKFRIRKRVKLYEDVVEKRVVKAMSPELVETANGMALMAENIDMLHIFQRNSQGLTSDTWKLKLNQFLNFKKKLATGLN